MRFLLAWRDKQWVVPRRLLLHGVNLYGESAVRPRQGPAIRNFQPVNSAKIRVINLSGISAKRSFREANQSHQEPALLVKIKTQRQLVFVVGRNQVGCFA